MLGRKENLNGKRMQVWFYSIMSFNHTVVVSENKKYVWNLDCSECFGDCARNNDSFVLFEIKNNISDCF